MKDTSDSDAAIVVRAAGNMRRILAIQGRINHTDVNNLRIISVKDAFRKDFNLPLASSSITLTCSFCDKKVVGDAVKSAKIRSKHFQFSTIFALKIYIFKPKRT